MTPFNTTRRLRLAGELLSSTKARKNVQVVAEAMGSIGFAKLLIVTTFRYLLNERTCQKRCASKYDIPM